MEKLVREVVKAAGAPPPMAAYSQAFKVGNFVFVAGQLGDDPKTGKIVWPEFPESPIEAQTAQVLNNIKAILQGAGATLDDVVYATIYLVDLKDFYSYNKVFRTFFKVPPPRATVNVKGLLPGPEALIEIQVIAYIQEK